MFSPLMRHIPLVYPAVLGSPYGGNVAHFSASRRPLGRSDETSLDDGCGRGKPDLDAGRMAPPSSKKEQNPGGGK